MNGSWAKQFWTPTLGMTNHLVWKNVSGVNHLVSVPGSPNHLSWGCPSHATSTCNATTFIVPNLASVTASGFSFNHTWTDIDGPCDGSPGGVDGCNTANGSFDLSHAPADQCGQSIDTGTSRHFHSPACWQSCLMTYNPVTPCTFPTWCAAITYDNSGNFVWSCGFEIQECVGATYIIYNYVSSSNLSIVGGVLQTLGSFTMNLDSTTFTGAGRCNHPGSVTLDVS
jgi:hypothetical protein